MFKIIFGVSRKRGNGMAAANAGNNRDYQHIPSVFSKDDMVFLTTTKHHSLPIRKLSQKVNEGLLETVLLIKAPLKGVPLKEKIELNEKYTVVLCFYPHGFRPVLQYLGCLSLLIAVYSGADEITFAKFETSTLGSDGSKWFPESSGEYYPFPSDIFFKIKNIGSRNEIERRPEFFIHSRRVRFEIKITIDTKRKQPEDPISDKSKEVIQCIRDKIHSSKFGNASFLVGGVKFYAHREILFENDNVFLELFQSIAMKEGCYVLPDIYPQTFEKRLISCYLRERNYCKECFLYPSMCGCDETTEDCTTGQ